LASVSTITGVRKVSASFRAVIIRLKHSSMVDGATTTLGVSPGCPKIEESRSPCSTFVGSPVAGPPRCTSTTTSGISAMTPRPISSVLRAMPGPEVMVTAVFPA
jgi:hypothetical protein